MKTFIGNINWGKIFSNLPNEDAGLLSKAIFQSLTTDEEIELPGALNILYSDILKDIKRLNKEECEKVDVNWDELIKYFNRVTGKKTRTVPEKAKRQLRQRLRSGYTKEDLMRAIQNCFNDDYHKETKHKYLTLEFITREDKLDKYLNVPIQMSRNQTERRSQLHQEAKDRG